jgi:predicted exporter
MRKSLSTALWAVFVCVAAVIVARANYTADLSAFLPQSPTPTQRLLVDQLREGIASRLIMIGVEGADAPVRAKVSISMARRLRGDAHFTSVNNGEQSGIDHDREYLFNHRYLLSETVTPERFTVDGLKEAIGATVDLIASPAGVLVKSLLPRDPTGEMVQIIDQVGGGQSPRTLDGAWISKDGQRALLVAQTKAAGSDTDGQEQAIERIRQAFTGAVAEQPVAARSNLRLKMSGPGVFSVSARGTIEHEVVRLSLLSTALIVVLLLVVYRSVTALILGLVPVASGALAGVAAVALGVGVVHGITLGFGITLIGESVDYSIYLFIQSRLQARTDSAGGGAVWSGPLWAIIGLGVLTSICGFAALLPSGFPGLAQLGLYSISGLVAAALVTRFVLPSWLPQGVAIRNVAPLGAAFAAGIQRVRGAAVGLTVVALLAILTIYAHRNSMWNRELSALSPVTQADQDLDAQLRADIGAPDVRYLIVIPGATQETVLESAERVGKPLEQLADSGSIAGFDSPARFLPSLAAQRARQASLPDAQELNARLRQATQDLPIRPDKLAPFVSDVEAARASPLLTRADLKGTSLATGFDSMLVAPHDAQPGQWMAIMPLHAATNGSNYVDIDVEKVRAAVATSGASSAVVLDLKGEADALYSTYLSQIVRLSLIGLGAIVLLLLIALRSPTRVVRVITPLAVAVLVVTAGLLLVHHELSILHVIGMLLIVAVGSNYALFFDRRATEHNAEAVPLTLASLIVANLATVLGFGVLATSSVPVLSAFGSTVAPGALLALVFSALVAGRGPLPPSAA